MSKLFLISLLLVTSLFVKAQNVGIGTTTPNTNAALEISSSNKGLLIPRTSTTSRNSIVAPPKGLMVYDTSYSAFYYHDGGRWRQINDGNKDSLLIIDNNPSSFPVNITPGYSGTNNLSGTLYDDGGPNGNYSNNILCSYQVGYGTNAIGMNVIIDEMNLESPYDVLSFGAGSITGTTTGKYFIPRGDAALFTFTFNTNGINNLSGFKLRWSQVLLPNDNDTPPLYGWYMNYKKAAARGGVYAKNNWVSDSLGYYSFAFGDNPKVKGESSAAFGTENVVNSRYSFATGSYNKVIGDHSTAMGYGNQANDDYSIAIGEQNVANGLYTTAMGYRNNANGFYSTAFAKDNFANGYASMVTGNSNIANGFSSLVTGVFNDSILSRQGSPNSSTPLFIIGNGDNASTRSNAMVVLKSGNVAIGDNGNPVNKLQITGTITNVGLGDNTGMMTLGYTSSTNMVMDQNDIQVRLGGAVSDLYLQRLGGSIGIGNTGVPAYQLELSTNSAGKPGSSTWSIASDSRLKQNINPYTQGLQQLMQINPVSFHYNEQSGFDTKPEYVGIIAQDLQKIAPYMVSTVKRKDTDYLSVDNGAMTYMLINAVKEQQAQIEKLQAAIELLKIKK